MEKGRIIYSSFFFFFFSLLLHKNYLFAQEITLQKEYAWRAEGLSREGGEDGEKQDDERRRCRPEPERHAPLHLQGMAPKETVSSVTSGTHPVLSVSLFLYLILFPWPGKTNLTNGEIKVISQVQYDCLISTLSFFDRTSCYPPSRHSPCRTPQHHLIYWVHRPSPNGYTTFLFCYASSAFLGDVCCL